MFSFGLTFKAFDWVKTGGLAKIFYIIASVQVAICLLGIPMCKLNHLAVSQREDSGD